MPSKINKVNYKNKYCKQKYKDIKRKKKKGILNKPHIHITCKKGGVV